MPSTFTPNFNIELIASGEQVATWGDTTNSNWGLVDTALGNTYTQAQVNALTWDFATDITGKPTTLSGYGITDAYTQTQVNALTWDWSDITSGKPTTLSGYGITDAYTKTEADGKYLLNTTDSLTGNLTVTGDITGSGTGTFATGVGNGSVGMTINDGQGNANITFNHIDGSTDIAGNAARIVVNTDSTSACTMTFETLSNATLGAVSTTPKMTLSDTGLDVVGDVTATNFNGALSGNADTATTWATGRTISLTGAVTGTSAAFDGSGNLSISTTATSDPTLTLSGDVTGSATFTNLGNATLTAVVGNDTHTHAFNNLTGKTTGTGTYTTSGIFDANGGYGVFREDGVTITPVSYPKTLHLKFAQTSTLASSPGTGTWRQLMTFQGWTTHNASYPTHQLSFGTGAIGHRESTSTTTWGGWQTLAYLSSTVAAATSASSNVNGTTFVAEKNSGTTYNTMPIECRSTAGNVGIGFHASGATAVTLSHTRGTADLVLFNTSNTIAANFVMTANAHIRWATHGGGWFMQDTTWIRSYGTKRIYCNSSDALAIATPGDVVAGYSDMRLKTKVDTIDNALEKVNSLEGFIYERNELAQELGYKGGERRAGLSAQDMERVLPEVVKSAPINIESDNKTDYLTIDYNRVVPLLVEAIKELTAKVEALEAAK